MDTNDQRETFTYEDAWQQERLLTFMEAMEGGNTPFLAAQEKKALEAGVPIIRTQTQSLIKFLLMQKKPARILEIGTGTGFSALFMLTYAPTIQKDSVPAASEAAPEQASSIPSDPDQESCTQAAIPANPAAAPHLPILLSIEKDEARYQEALANVQEAAAAGALDDARRIDLRLGDAADILPQLTGTFDFIFMDAAKGQYIHFLPEVLRLLAEDGILLSDNIFKGGEILESRYAVRRRDRTIHKRMREYIYALTHHPQLQTLLLEEGDGAAVSLKTSATG